MTDLNKIWRGRRHARGEISLVKGKIHCKNCGHHKMWSKPRGLTCTRCGALAR